MLSSKELADARVALSSLAAKGKVKLAGLKAGFGGKLPEVTPPKWPRLTVRLNPEMAEAVSKEAASYPSILYKDRLIQAILMHWFSLPESFRKQVVDYLAQ